MQASETEDQSYSDTSPFEVSECSLIPVSLYTAICRSVMVKAKICFIVWCQIGILSPFFTSISIEAKKYRDNLFMVAPFYHRLVKSAGKIGRNIR